MERVPGRAEAGGLKVQERMTWRVARWGHPDDVSDRLLGGPCDD